MPRCFSVLRSGAETMLSAMPLGEVGTFGKGLLCPFCSSAPCVFNQVRVECLEMENRAQEGTPSNGADAPRWQTDMLQHWSGLTVAFEYRIEVVGNSQPRAEIMSKLRRCLRVALDGSEFRTQRRWRRIGEIEVNLYGSPFETKGAKPSRSPYSQLQLVGCTIEVITGIMTKSNHRLTTINSYGNKSAAVPCSASNPHSLSELTWQSLFSDEIYRGCLEVQFT